MRLVAVAITLLIAGCATSTATLAPGERAALAPTGKLRVGLYTGNPLSLVTDPASQERKGVAFDLGREMARRMGVPFEPVVYPALGALLDAAKSDQWDVAFFLASPAREKDFDFTPALVETELGYLAPRDSSLRAAADVDRQGIRVAVVEKGQTDVLLSRSLKTAVLVRAPGLAAVVERVASGHADAIAANKTILHELTGQLPGSRILDGRFAAERLAMALPKGRPAGLAYARRFVEDAQASGLVSAALQRAGARGAVVAPAH